MAFERAAALACLVSLAAQCGTAAADTAWSNGWTFSRPPTMSGYNSSYDAWPSPPIAAMPAVPAAFAANGDIVFGAGVPTYAEYQFTRITADGALRWSVNLDWYDGVYSLSAAAVALLASDDGGAFVALGDGYDGYGDHVIRVDADGTVRWSRDVPTGWLADAGAGRIASASGTALTLLDVATGDVIWQRRMNPADNASNAGGVAADTDGNLYATFPIGTSTGSAFRIVKFDTDGNVIWNVETELEGGAAIAGIGSAAIYVRTANDVRGFRRADGSLEWTQAIVPAARVLAGGDPVEPIVVAPDAIVRLADDDGSPRWSVPLEVATPRAAALADAVFVDTGAGLVKVDLATGVIEWTVPLPADSGRFSIGGVASELVTMGPGPYGTRAAAPTIRRIESGTGSVSEPVGMAAVAQGVMGQSIVDTADDVLSAASVADIDASEIRVRAIDGASGATRWESIDPVDINLSPADPDFTVGGDAVAVVTALNNVGLAAGATRVELLDRVSGAVRWQTTLADIGQGPTMTVAPAIDANGDVIVSAGLVGDCEGGGNGCEHWTVFKLAAADGSALWRADRAGPLWFSTQVYPQSFVVTASGIAVAGADADGLRDAPVVMLSSIDGSENWTSSAFGMPTALYAASDGNLIVEGLDGWGKLDAASGAPLLTGEDPPPFCFTACFDYATIITANDDVVTAGGGDAVPVLTLRRGESGSAGTYVPEYPATPGLSSTFNRVYGEDASGKVLLRLARSQRPRGMNLQFLTRLDLGTGTLGPQQMMSDGDDDVLDAAVFATAISASSDRVFFDTLTLTPPGVSTTGASRVDAASVANGNLSVSASFDAPRASANGRVGFHATVTYAGDQPVSGAALVVRLPWSSGVDDIVCTSAAAANCVMDTRSGNVHATFDIMPGGSVAISGSVGVLPLDADLATLSAKTFGPFSLAEMNTFDNFARASVVEELFADGFESE
jgi:hypothetical protein